MHFLISDPGLRLSDSLTLLHKTAPSNFSPQDFIKLVLDSDQQYESRWCAHDVLRRRVWICKPKALRVMMPQTLRSSRDLSRFVLRRLCHICACRFLCCRIDLMPESMVEQLFVGKDEWWSAPEKAAGHYSHWGFPPDHCVPALGISLEDLKFSQVDGKGPRLNGRGEPVHANGTVIEDNPDAMYGRRRDERRKSRSRRRSSRSAARRVLGVGGEMEELMLVVGEEQGPGGERGIRR